MKTKNRPPSPSETSRQERLFELNRSCSQSASARWRIDDETRDVGREGLAKVREELAKHPLFPKAVRGKPHPEPKHYRYQRVE